MSELLLDIRDLIIEADIDGDWRPIVNGLSMGLHKGEIIGLTYASDDMDTPGNYDTQWRMGDAVGFYYDASYLADFQLLPNHCLPEQLYQLKHQFQWNHHHTQ